MSDWKPLKRKDIPKQSHVILDDITANLIRPFDYESDGTEKFYPFEIPVDLPLQWGIGPARRGDIAVSCHQFSVIRLG